MSVNSFVRRFMARRRRRGLRRGYRMPHHRTGPSTVASWFDKPSSLRLPPFATGGTECASCTHGGKFEQGHLYDVLSSCQCRRRSRDRMVADEAHHAVKQRRLQSAHQSPALLGTTRRYVVVSKPLGVRWMIRNRILLQVVGVEQSLLPKSSIEIPPRGCWKFIHSQISQ